MRINGEWYLCDDGIIRPTIQVDVEAGDGSFRENRFLIDSGADRTVSTSDLLNQLGSLINTPSGMSLASIGGTQAFVTVQTVLEFECDDGSTVRVRGQFAAFTDPTALDMSVLGRDVTSNFDVILSHPRNEVVLLATPHRYRVET
jgi:hypothetical protein